MQNQLQCFTVLNIHGNSTTISILRKRLPIKKRSKGINKAMKVFFFFKYKYGVGDTVTITYIYIQYIYKIT